MTGVHSQAGSELGSTENSPVVDRGVRGGGEGGLGGPGCCVGPGGGWSDVGCVAYAHPSAVEREMSRAVWGRAEPSGAGPGFWRLHLCFNTGRPLIPGRQSAIHSEGGVSPGRGLESSKRRKARRQKAKSLPDEPPGGRALRPTHSATGDHHDHTPGEPPPQHTTEACPRAMQPCWATTRGTPSSGWLSWR